MKNFLFFIFTLAPLLGASVAFPAQQPDKLLMRVLPPTISIYFVPDGSGNPVNAAFT